MIKLLVRAGDALRLTAGVLAITIVAQAAMLATMVGLAWFFFG